ncbi:RNA polymerase-associated protein CTR9 [Pelomyxa schiedti]|nr:RNA polymerase-associated protein CTR9 [Pelomyxa schiedti]
MSRKSVDATTEESSGVVVTIPLQSGPPLQLQSKDLENVDELLDILKTETPPLSVWRVVALECRNRGNSKNFTKILKAAANPAMLDVQFRDEKPSDKISILNTLAEHYVLIASKERDQKRKDKKYKLATDCYNRSDRISYMEPSTWLGKGVMVLSQGDLVQAGGEFRNVLERDPHNTAALLGQACIAFNQHRYDDALKHYTHALRTNSRACAPSVRVGVAMCHNQLHNSSGSGTTHRTPGTSLSLTKRALERALQLDPTNVDALVGKAILDHNEGNMQGAGKLMATAYQFDAAHPVVLNHLADHFFFKKEMDKALKFAQTALSQHNAADQVQAESYYVMGRVYHVTEQWDTAFQSYTYASHKNPNYPLPWFGLGQMWIQRGHRDKAIECFQKVLNLVPDNYETHKILGFLYNLDGKKDEAVFHLQRVTETHPEDDQSWQELGNILNISEPERAAQAYRHAVGLLKRAGRKLPAELCNNVGVLYHQSSKLDKAQKWYLRSIAATGCTIDQYKACNVTVTYNLARLYETKFEFAEAENLYKGILKEHPNYVDCYLRLGLMSRERGKFGEAAEWFKECFTSNTSHPDAWTLLGCLHLEKNEWRPAQKKFERIIQQSATARDPYSYLALAYIYYAAKSEKAEKSHHYLKIAMDFYWSVLKHNTTNPYAANGLGIIAAEKGNLQLAMDIFTQVRDACPDLPDVSLNMAHIYMLRHEFVHAIALYQHCIQKFFGLKDVQLSMFLAKAYFHAGKLDSCIKMLQSVVHLAPHNHSLWFNLALALREYACVSLAHTKSSTALRQIINDLKSAQSIFTWLSKVKPVSLKFRHDPIRAASYAETCGPLIIKGRSFLTAAEKDELAENERKQQQREAMKQTEEQKRIAQEQRIQKEREQRAIEERAAIEDMQRQSDVARSWKLPKKETREKPDRGDSGNEEDESRKPRKRRESRKRKKQRNEEEATPQQEEENPQPAENEEAIETVVGEDVTTTTPPTPTSPSKRHHSRKRKKNLNPEEDSAVANDLTKPEKKKRRKSEKRSERKKKEAERGEEGGSDKASPKRKKRLIRKTAVGGESAEEENAGSQLNQEAQPQEEQGDQPNQETQEQVTDPVQEEVAEQPTQATGDDAQEPAAPEQQEQIIPEEPLPQTHTEEEQTIPDAITTEEPTNVVENPPNPTES